MIAREGFRRMKPTAVLLNTSRGKVVDETALLAALKAGKLAGYAADVLADEPSFTTTKARSKLIAYARVHDNVLLTPHIGGTTVEARRATDVFLAEKLSREFR
jgi:D-3-phosphoglycerate dehydrogenase